MRRREERRRKDELIIVSSDNTSSLQHPTPITESGHIAITKFGHAMAHLPTVVVYVNKHTQKIDGNKPTTNVQQNQHWLTWATHQAIMDDECRSLSPYCPTVTPTSSQNGNKAQLHQKFCHVLLITDA